MVCPTYTNQFQINMSVTFNNDILSMAANVSNIMGREALVYKYIGDIVSLFQPVDYRIPGNPSGLYSDYDNFKKHFVRYWRNALGLSIEASDKLKTIFDEEISAQTSCLKMTITSVFFEEGKALTTDGCLNAVYEVLKLV